MNKYLQTNIHYFLIIVFVFLCYHFLWFDAFTMKWDLAEQYLPWRYFTGKSISKGILPFWNPYQLGGYPSFADPQSSAWYYPAWLIGGTVGYSMKIIELEFLSLLILGALGFFMLSKKIGNSINSSFIFALCYSINGFFIGNAQHLTWISAAAWIPWLFYQYLFIRQQQYNFHLIWFLLILFLFAASSYPAFLITCIYIIIIDQAILFFKSTNKKRFLFNKTVLLLLCFISIFPILYSIASSMQYFSRGAGITLQKALQHPFSWQSMLSVLVPFASFKNNELFKTDISMSNAYMGLLPFILFVIYLISKKNKRSTTLLILSFAFLLIAVGEQTPIRTLLYKYLPGFNLFRFPSLFRYFFILFFLLFSVTYYDSLKIYIDKYRTKIIKLLLVVILLFTCFLLYHFKSFKYFNLFSIEKLSLQFEQSSFIEHIVFQLSIGLVLLSFVCIALFYKKEKPYLFIFIIVDLFLSVQLNAAATMVHSTKTKEVDKLIQNADENFNTPKFQALSKSIDQQYEYRWPLNWNMNCYFSEIAIDGYNPFVLNTFNKLESSVLRDSTWANPWLYFPSKIIYADSINSISSGVAWIKSTSNIPSNFKSNTSVINLSFNPNGLKLHYKSDSVAALVLAQNPFPGWKARIDGKEIPIETANITQQLVMLEAGEHQLEWGYKNNILNIIALLHLLLFLFFTALATIKTFKKHA